ncbi:MAG: patatin-like phospholipase family protein [Actinobacteria bacterium]|nr:patatin-like phospholipase family protein [Actinomycetota bacterium]
MSILHLRRAKRQAPRTVFVLGGGGNLGAIQVGMLRALFERGITPDAVVGCSVGAINAAGVAVDPTLDGVRRMEEVWTLLRDEAVCPAGRLSSLRLLAHRAKSLQPNDGLRRLLETWLPCDTFDDTAIPLHVVAASLDTGRARWFSSGPVIEPILASAALPGIFPPVVIGNETFIDGAVVDNVPISRAAALGAERIVVLHVGNFERKRPTPKRPIEVLVQAFSIARNHRFIRDMENPPEGVELMVLPSIDPGAIRYDDFRQSRRLIAQSHQVAAAYLDGLSATATA